MKKIKSLKWIIWIVVSIIWLIWNLTGNNTEAFTIQLENWKSQFVMTDRQFLNMFNEQYVIKIWCFKNWKAWKEDYTIVCRWWKNIQLPTRADAKLFVDKYFTDYQTEFWTMKICNEWCQRKIANRFAIINFESSFNTYAKSSTHDYWYIQLHNRPDMLWKTKESIDILEERFADHKQSVCIDKYWVNENDWRTMFKCLAMRHNWQKSINNWYSNRALVWSDFYVDYFKTVYKE